MTIQRYAKITIGQPVTWNVVVKNEDEVSLIEGFDSRPTDVEIYGALGIEAPKEEVTA